MTGIKFMSFCIIRKQKPEQWAVRFKLPDGRIIDRRLKDATGRICPSTGVRRIKHEDPEIKSRAHIRAIYISNELDDGGEFSVKCKLTFREGMEQYLEWHKKYRNNPQIHSHADRALKVFKDKKIAEITRKEVRKWIEELEKHLSHNTIKNSVSPPKGMYNWLKKELVWDGENPFTGHEWKSQVIPPEVKPTVTPEELKLALNLMIEHPNVVQAMILAYYTGLRPSEVYRIAPEDFNHRDLILTVHPKKNLTQDRLIAIPQCLSNWVKEHEHDWQVMNANTIQHRMAQLQEKHPSLVGLTMESFRKNFSDMMDAAVVEHEFINAHQGRFQTSVLRMHYLRDKMRAVRRMRPHIDKVFGKIIMAISTVPKNEEKEAKSDAEDKKKSCDETEK